MTFPTFLWHIAFINCHVHLLQYECSFFVSVGANLLMNVPCSFVCITPSSGTIIYFRWSFIFFRQFLPILFRICLIIKCLCHFPNEYHLYFPPHSFYDLSRLFIYSSVFQIKNECYLFFRQHSYWILAHYVFNKRLWHVYIWMCPNIRSVYQ